MAKLIATGKVTAAAAGTEIPAVAAIQAAYGNGIRFFFVRLANQSSSVIAYVHPPGTGAFTLADTGDPLPILSGNQPVTWSSPDMKTTDGNLRVASAGDAATVGYSVWALTDEA